LIACSLMGGIGNQMFQIASTTSLAYDNNDICVYTLDIRGLPTSYQIQKMHNNTVFSKITYDYDFSWINKSYKEQYFHFKKLPYVENTIYEGYFQSEKYFFHNKKLINELFKPTEYINQRIQNKYENILNDSHVAIHVRRGDYVKLADHHYNLAETTRYYEDAMQKFKNHKFVFFSDDIKWCMSHFGSEHLYIDGEIDVIQMYLMSYFKNIIIANSTFSWWAAWLEHAHNNKNVLAPKQWFGFKKNHLLINDLIPDRWIKV